MAHHRVIDGRFLIEHLVAIQGLKGCTDRRCTRLIERATGKDLGCAGYHCPTCLAPTSMYGHRCPQRGGR